MQFLNSCPKQMMWQCGQRQFPKHVREGSVAYLHYVFCHKRLLYDSTTSMDYICCTHVLPRTSQALCFITGVKAASFEILANLCINASSLYRWLGKGSSFFLLTWSHSLLVSLMLCHMWLETRQKFKLVYTISWVTFVIIQQISCVHTLY